MRQPLALCLALVAVMAAGAARAGDAPVGVRVVGPDGKPAAGAKAWVSGYASDDAALPEPTGASPTPPAG